MNCTSGLHKVISHADLDMELPGGVGDVDMELTGGVVDGHSMQSSTCTLRIDQEPGLPSDCGGLSSLSSISDSECNTQIPAQNTLGMNQSQPMNTDLLDSPLLALVGTSHAEQLETVHRMPSLPEMFEAECQKRVEQLEERVRAARVLNSDTGEQLAQKYERELESLRECELEHLENVQVSIKEQLVKENMVKVSELTEDLERTHRLEVDQLHAHYEEKVRLLTEQLEATDRSVETLETQLHNVEVAHDSNMRHLTDTHSKQMQALIAKLQLYEAELESKTVETQEFEEHWKAVGMEMEQKYKENIELLEQQHLTDLNMCQKELEQRTTESAHKADELQKCRDTIVELTRTINEQHLLESSLTTLNSEIEHLRAERESLQQTNCHLMTVLSESVRTTVDIETRVSQCLASFEASLRTPSVPSTPAGTGNILLDRRNIDPVGSSGATYSPRDSKPGRLSTGLLDDGSSVLTDAASVCSDEGLDVSQRFTETMFSSLGLESDAEDMVTDLSSRLQRSVERLMDRLVEASRQIQDGRHTETELRSSFERCERAVDELTIRCDDLEQQLKQETQTREFLAVEFYKADGLVKGYMAEKQATDDCIQSLENRNESLIQEMEKLRSRVIELEQGHEEIYQREQDLEHQRQTLTLGVNESQRGLLQDNMKLNEDLRSVTKQLEQERLKFQAEICQLEASVEDLRTQLERVVDDQKLSDDDYQQKIAAVERQIMSDKQFIELQAAEREQERDEYHSKITQLEAIIRNKDKKEGVTERLKSEIAELEELLHEKTERCDMLEEAESRLKNELEVQQSTITELHEIIRHLENDLDERCKTVRQHEKRLDEMTSEVSELNLLNQRLMDELQTRTEVNGDNNGLRQTIQDLEEQLDGLSSSERLAQLRIHQLEEELKNLRTLEEELMQDKEVLQKQVCDQLNQLSHLRSRNEELTLRQSTAIELHGEQSKVTQLNDALELRDKEVYDLSEQLTVFQERLCDQTEELQHRNAQIEVLKHERDNISQQLAQTLNENSQLQLQLTAVQQHVDATPMSVLTQTLLTDKNNEIDELTAEVDRLNAEINKLNQHLSDSARSQQSTTLADICISYEQTIETLRDKLQQKDFELCQMQETVDKQHMDLNELLIEKEIAIDQLKDQVTSLLKEIDSINESFTNLQDDYSQVETMAKNKQQQIEQITDELAELRSQVCGHSELQVKFETAVKQLEKELQEKQNIIEEKEEELCEFETKVEDQEKEMSNVRLKADKLTVELAEKNEKIDMLQEQLKEQEMLVSELHACLKLSEAEQMKSSEVDGQQPCVDIEDDFETLHKAVEENISMDTEIIEQHVEGISAPLNAILNMLHAESLHVLSLSDVDFHHDENKPPTTEFGRQQYDELNVAEQSWNEEKRCLLASVQALKQLLANMADNAPQSVCSDWRADILRAVHEVFTRDLETVHALLHSYTHLHSTDGSQVLDVLERTISEQESVHRDAIHLLISADRRSMASELSDTRTEIESLKRELLAARETSRMECERLSHKCSASEQEIHARQLELDQASARITCLEGQIQTHLQEIGQVKTLENEVELQSSRLQQALLNVTNLERQLDSQHVTCEQAVQRSNDLERQLESQRLTYEQAVHRSNDLERQLESQRLTYEQAVQRSNDLERQLESQCLTYEQAVQRSNDLERQLESQRMIYEQAVQRSNDLERQLKSQRLTYEQAVQRSNDLERQLESQRMIYEQAVQRSNDLERQFESQCLTYEQAVQRSNDLERQFESQCMICEQAVQRSNDLETLCGTQALELEQSSVMIRDLQQKLHNEHLEFENKLAELRAALDIERLHCDELKTNVSFLHSSLENEKVLNRELTMQRAESADDDDVVEDLRAALDIERSNSLELSTSLEDERQRVVLAAAEVSRVKNELSKQRSLCSQLQQNVEQLTNKNQELTQEVSTVHANFDTLRHEYDQLQAESDHLQNTTGLEQMSNTDHKTISKSRQFMTSAGDTALSRKLLDDVSRQADSLIHQKQMEMSCQRLQLIAAHLQSEYNHHVGREEMLGDGDVESQSLSAILTDLSCVQAALSSSHIVNSTASSLIPSLNEAILRHNAELTTFIGRLSTEKQNLLLKISKLQETLSAYGSRQLQHDDVKHQLSESQTELLRLKETVNKLQHELQKERQKELNASNGSVIGKEKIQHLYAKYLRAESFRKALIYQKKYLLLLIGGFRDCEEETLAMIAHLGVHPSDGDLPSRRLTPLSRFRSAARVIIAISRLKYVVRKWHRATHCSAASVTGSTHSAANNGLSTSQERTIQSLQVTDCHNALVGDRHTKGRQAPPTPPTRDRKKPVEHTRHQDTYHPTSTDSSGSLIQKLEDLQAKLGKSGSRSAYTSNRCSPR